MSSIVLIVEDEQDLVDVLEYNLQHEGYRTRSALTGQNALNEVAQEPLPDLILLDLMLPDMSGTEVCRFVRQNPKTAHIPIIMVTAKGEEIDRVVGFEVGADDYVVKPYSIRELLLRVRAMLRRVQIHVSTTEFTQIGLLKLDSEGHQAWIHDNEVSLTALEFRLLQTLIDRRGRVQTRERLLQDVWGYHADVTTRTVDTHIKRLREKLGDAGAYIDTVRGVGYRFNNPSEDEC